MSHEKDGARARSLDTQVKDGPDSSPRFCYKKSSVDCAYIWSSQLVRAHYISSQQPKVSDSRATNQEHWSVTLSGNWTLTRPCLGISALRARPGPDIACAVLTCDHNGASCHNSHQMTWHQAKPAHINECKSFKMSHCSGRFEFWLHDTQRQLV